MKKYLLSSLIVLVCFGLRTSFAVGEDYYNTTLNSWGFRTKLLQNDPAVPDKYFVFLTSQITKSTVLTPKYVLICDSQYSQPEFSCDQNTVNGNIKIGDTSIYYNNSSVIVLSQYSMLVPDQREQVRQFIDGLNRTKPISIVPKTQKIYDFSSVSFDYFKYSVLIFLIYFFVVSVFIPSYQDYKQNGLSNIKKYFNVVYAFYVKFRWLFLIAGFVTLGVYFASIKFVLPTYKLTFDLVATLKTKLAKQIAIVGLQYLFILFSFLYFIPTIFDYIFYVVSTLKKRVVNPQAFKYIIFFFMCVFVFLNAMYDIKSLTTANIVLVLLLILFLYTLRGELLGLFTKKEKLYNLAVLGGVLGFGLLFGWFRQQSLAAFSYNNLTGDEDLFVMLPFEFEVPEKTYFFTHGIDPTAPLYVDEYLVSHPDYLTVINSPLKKFVPTTDYQINFSEDAEYFSAIQNNADLRSVLQTNKPSSFFYFPQYGSYEYTVALGINCSDALLDDHIKLQLDGLAYSLLYFPGCTAGEQHEYVFPYSPKFILPHDVYVQLLNIDPKYVTKLEFSRDGQPVDLQFFATWDVVNRGGGTELVNYSTKVSSISFHRSAKEFIDIADIINQLITQKLIKTKTKLWTTSQQVFILKQ